MIQLARANRWSLAFADLSLLMLGFVVLSFAHPVPAADSQLADDEVVAPPSARFEWKASTLFEPREAMLTMLGQEKVREVAGAVGTRPARINLSVTGRASASARLDRWELSAARMAAFARALKAASVDDAAIMFGGQGAAVDDEPQRLIISITRPPSRIASANGTGLASK